MSTRPVLKALSRVRISISIVSRAFSQFSVVMRLTTSSSCASRYQPMPPTDEAGDQQHAKPMPRRVPTFKFENFILFPILATDGARRRGALREHRPGFFVREFEAQADHPCITHGEIGARIAHELHRGCERKPARDRRAIRELIRSFRAGGRNAGERLDRAIDVAGAAMGHGEAEGIVGPARERVADDNRRADKFIDGIEARIGDAQAQ